jgi:hypothetical protein
VVKVREELVGRERGEKGEERNERKREGRVGVWRAGSMRLRDELGRVEERSSIRASLLSLAESPYLHEVGSAQFARADLPNTKMCKILV